MKKKTVLIFTAVLLIFFSGCGKGDEDAFIGTWNLEHYSGAQGEFGANELLALGLSGTIEIRSDHTAEISLMGRTADVRWELKDSSVISFSYPGNENTVEMTLNNGSLIVEDEISVMTFVK